MRKIATFFLIIILIGVIAIPKTVFAQSATNQVWASSITYYTPDATADPASDSMTIIYYQGTSTYTAGPFPMRAHAAGSVSVASTTGMPDSFSGSAVLSATVPIIATAVQYSKNETGSYSRAFYSAADATKAGETFYLATVRAANGNTSTIAVQNISSSQITAQLDFYAVGATSPTFSHEVQIASSASYISSIKSIPTFPGGTFDGSLKITATGGQVLATAVETQDFGRNIISYEGSKAGSVKIFMPTATCRRGFNEATSYYAVQNAGTATASVKISYYDTAGVKVGEMPVTEINQGAKLATNPCLQNLLINTLGSAVIESTNDVPLIAIGKYLSNDGLLTAFVGETSGATKIAAPYIRWAADPYANYRAYIAVMNVSNTPATNIVARYYDSTGTEVAAHTLATVATPLDPFTKVNTRPDTANALTNGSFGINPFGGAIEITSDQPIIALVRLTTNTAFTGYTTIGEDYNAVPVAP